MRFALPAFLILSLALAADEPQRFNRVRELAVGDARVGDYGPLAPARREWNGRDARHEYKIIGVNSKTQLVVEDRSGGDGLTEPDFKITAFMIDGIDASKAVSGRPFEALGWYKVTRTARFVGTTRTILVLSPETKAECAARIAAEEKRLADRRKRDSAIAKENGQQEDRDRRAHEAAEQKAREENANRQAAERAARGERVAVSLLRLVHVNLDAGKDGMGGYKPEAIAQARKDLESLVKDYSKTKAAAESRKLLDSLGK